MINSSGSSRSLRLRVCDGRNYAGRLLASGHQHPGKKKKIPYSIWSFLNLMILVIALYTLLVFHQSSLVVWGLNSLSVCLFVSFSVSLYLFLSVSLSPFFLSRQVLWFSKVFHTLVINSSGSARRTSLMLLVCGGGNHISRLLASGHQYPDNFFYSIWSFLNLTIFLIALYALSLFHQSSLAVWGLNSLSVYLSHFLFLSPSLRFSISLLSLETGSVVFKGVSYFSDQQLGVCKKD